MKHVIVAGLAGLVGSLTAAVVVSGKAPLAQREPHKLCEKVRERESRLCSCCCHFKPVTDYTQKNATGGGFKKKKDKGGKKKMRRHVRMKSF